MEMLYDRTHTQTDTYCYKINGGGVFLVKEKGEVVIVFENKKFVSASYPMSETYTRNGWRILAAINEEIELLDQALKGE